MKTSLRFILFILIVGGLTSCATTWGTYSNETNDITFRMPAAPKTTSQTVDTAMGPLTVVMQSAEVNSVYYTTSVVSYPEGTFDGRTDDDVLDGAREGAVSNIDGRLLQEDPITLGSATGRELRIESQDKQFLIFARIYFAGNRLYQFIAVTKPGLDVEKDIRTFFGSVRLTSVSD